jgi:hypothetical protein
LLPDLQVVSDTVYLLHFDRRYRHAGHYIGATTRDNYETRIEEHRRGNGARLISVITAAGIGFVVARVWMDAERGLERKLKKLGGASRICPICREAAAREQFNK